MVAFLLLLLLAIAVLWAAENAKVDHKMTIRGTTYTVAADIPADGVVTKGKENLTALAAAKSGQLTTRTDDDTGELTMAPGHGITTGQRLDVFWTGGHRRGMTVGTVAGDVVPIDGGSGDVLPANLTAITAQVPAEEAFNVVGNNLQFLAARASRRGAVSFCDSGNAEHLGFELNPTTGVDGGYQWYTGSGVTNPISGDTIAKVFFSNGSTAGTSNIRAEAGVN